MKVKYIELICTIRPHKLISTKTLERQGRPFIIYSLYNQKMYQSKNDFPWTTRKCIRIKTSAAFRTTETANTISKLSFSIGNIWKHVEPEIAYLQVDN